MELSDLPKQLQNAAGMTRLVVTLGYEPERIVGMLTTKYGLSDAEARDLLARTQEHAISVEES